MKINSATVCSEDKTAFFHCIFKENAFRLLEMPYLLSD